MADENKDKTIAELQEALEAERQEKETLRASMAAGQKIGEPVKGSLAVTYKDHATGKDVKHTVKFKRGHKFLFIGGIKYFTEGILAIANGKKPTAEQLEQNPDLASITQEFAVEHLTKLAQIKYGYLD